MFYSKNKIISYPSKSIIEDVMTRNGSPTEESFTPFNGCNYMFKEQFGDRVADITIKDILLVSAEFDVHKARPNEQVNRSYSAKEVTEYSTKLEDIKQYFIDKYINNILIGYKKNNNSLKKKDKEIQEQQKLYDEEEGNYVLSSDLMIKSEVTDSSTIIKARKKLPYLLKQLHNGSIYYRGSLLSFIIAAEKCYRIHSGEVGYTPKPRELARFGVYRVNGNGDITTRFRAEDNTAKPYRDLVAWIRGNNDNEEHPIGDVYFKAYLELLKVLDILDIDITKEDAKEYTSEYIRQAVCTHLASNEEYLNSYGFVDKNILDVLSPDKLFQVNQASEIEDWNQARIGIQSLAESTTKSIELSIKKNPERWKDRLDKVNKFLEVFCEICNLKEIKTVADYKRENSVLKKLDNSFVVIPVGKVKSLNLPILQYAVISTAGYLVCINGTDIVYRLQVLDVEEAVARMKGMSTGSGWREFGI